MKKYLIIFVCMFFMPAFGQKQGQVLIDSLRTILVKNPQNQTIEKANILSKLGNAYLNRCDFPEALQCFYDCQEMARKLNNNDLIAVCYRNFGVIYFYQQNFAKAEECNLKALAIFEQRNNLPQKGIILKALADNYLKNVDTLKAEKFYKAALKVLQQADDKKGQAAVYSNLSILYSTQYQKKLEMAFLAKNIWDSEKIHNPIPAINTGNIGVAYLDIVRYNQLDKTKPSALIPHNKNKLLKLSETYLNQAIKMSRLNNDVDDASYFTGVLAELQAYKSDYKKAYFNIRKYYETQDSVYSQENKNKIAALESKREMDLKNVEIQNKELQLGNQHKKMLLLMGGVAFLTIIGGLFYWQSISRKRTNNTLLKLNNELSEANKVKAKFFGIISHDLRSPVANLISLLLLQQRNPYILSAQQITDRENKISNSANALLETMEGMLLWSKGQMENFTPEIAAVPVSNLFSYLQKFFVNTTHINFIFLDAHDLTAYSDKDYLQTIMQNLTANAIKVLQPIPNALITWKAWQQNGVIFLSITDNGPGINAQQAKALYNETSVGGTRNGLGLHIIRDLAKAIGCTITIQPQTQGSQFLIKL